MGPVAIAKKSNCASPMVTCVLPTVPFTWRYSITNFLFGNLEGFTVSHSHSRENLGNIGSDDFLTTSVIKGFKLKNLNAKYAFGGFVFSGKASWFAVTFFNKHRHRDAGLFFDFEISFCCALTILLLLPFELFGVFGFEMFGRDPRAPGGPPCNASILSLSPAKPPSQDRGTTLTRLLTLLERLRLLCLYGVVCVDELPVGAA